MPNPIVFPDQPGFIDGAADFIADLAAEAITERGRFVIALSGGGTPQPIYARLSSADYRDRIDWSKVHVFFSDERCVPPDDARSNYRMAREALLDHVALPADHIHRIQGEVDPAQATLIYEQELQHLFRSSTFPTFDLICLGLGDNGHTASLFPGTAALREKERWVVAQYVEVMASWRITFTAPLINAARHIAVLVEGAAKADILQRVLEEPYQPDVLPAQLIQPVNGELHWLVDATAAAQLQSSLRASRPARRCFADTA
jgi:6-phosphogluconolactonase